MRRPPTQRLRFGLALIGVVALMAAVWAASGVFLPPDESEIAPLDVRSLGARVLVIAPHPDDEVIAPGGLTVATIASGARVRTVVVTAGDGFKKAARLVSGGRLSPAVFRELGMRRFPETQASFDALGVPAGDRVYLGYGDAGVMAMWDEGWDGCTATPYPFAYTPEAPYRGVSLVADLARVIEEYHPTTVIYPDPDDSHPDHWSTAAFVDYVLESRDYRGGRFTYLAHYGHYPFPWAYLPNAYMRPPPELVDRGTQWRSVTLTDAAREAKARSLSRHRSQLRIPHMRVYLRSFLRRNELFGAYAPARPRATASDASPEGDPDDRDLVVREPRAGSLPTLSRGAGSVGGIRLVRGTKRVWMGIAIEGGPRPGYDCGFHVRLFGDGAPRRLDITVVGDATKVWRHASDSIAPATVEVARSGDTLWIGLPASLLAGRRSIMVSGDVRPPGRKRSRSAWRVVLP
jgi:LmbE family N-acetylglucosaminyl deacetylase